MVKYYPQICKNGLAGVAQLVEHLTRNEKVACSSHVTSSKKKDTLCVSFFLVFAASKDQTCLQLSKKIPRFRYPAKVTQRR